MQLSMLHEAWDWKKFGKGAGYGAFATASALGVGNLIDNPNPSVNRMVHTDSRPAENPAKRTNTIVPDFAMAAAAEIPKSAPTECPKCKSPNALYVPCPPNTRGVNAIECPDCKKIDGIGRYKANGPPAPKPPATAVSPAAKSEAKATLFGSELPTIKAAADRNGCTGDLLNILLAIRKSENGTNGNEFGVLAPAAKGKGLATQAAWSAATVAKNYKRWQEAGGKGSFIQHLGGIYCPVGASNDPGGLNANWVANVTKWYNRIKSSTD